MIYFDAEIREEMFIDTGVLVIVGGGWIWSAVR